jgi:hypothetical protein
MNLSLLKKLFLEHTQPIKLGKSFLSLFLITLATYITSLYIWSTSPAIASINDDRYEGNIFILFAGNGSLVPPRLTLSESFNRKIPALLVFYVDDSSDCKQFSNVVSRLQEYYGRAASFIPLSVDSLPFNSNYSKTEAGYYYRGSVPQTILLNQEGKVVFDRSGQVAYEEIDDAFREVFDLLPRSESIELKRRSFNEFNSELVN